MQLVRLINARLSSEAKVLVKTPQKHAAVQGKGREYYLLDCETGRRQYLSQKQVTDMARKFGLHGEGVEEGVTTSLKRRSTTDQSVS